MSQSEILVRSFCAEPAMARHRLTLAGLPATFRLTNAASADVALVGADATSITAGLASGALCLVLDRPALLAAENLTLLLEAGVPVFPVLPLAATAGQSRPLAPLAGATLVRSALLSRATMADARFDHLTALQSLLGPLEDIALLAGDDRTYWGTARIQGGAPLWWSGQTDANVDRFEVDIAGLANRLELICSDNATARPALVTLADKTGTSQARGVYESGLRLFWRGVASALSGNPSVTQIKTIAPLLKPADSNFHLQKSIAQ